jgi:hypothetical protein
VRLWPRRYRPKGREPVINGELHGTEMSEATAARRISEEGLRHAQQRDPSVRAAGRSLRDLRARNGFAADWSAAMQRKGTT